MREVTKGQVESISGIRKRICKSTEARNLHIQYKSFRRVKA
jgi:hypothetical protein